MRLVRVGDPGQELPGLLDARGEVRLLSGHIDDFRGDSLSPAAIDRLRQIEPDSLPLAPKGQRLGPCLGGVGKIVCIGLNYHDHAAEVGKSAPSEPVIFLKAPSSLSGPTDPIEIPRASTQTDWEIELGIVIGTRAKYVEESDAKNHIAGYCTLNDVSERAFQSERQGQWTKGKSHDTHCPIGPWLVTADEVPDPQCLRLWCEVNGVRHQDSSTSQMIFDVAFLVSYLSQFMTLEPGDLIATGTPSGVGKGIKPTAVYLKPGDELGCGIEGLGDQKHSVVAA